MTPSDFFFYLTGDLNILNLKLLSPKKLMTSIYDSGNAFQCKPLMWPKQLTSGIIVHSTALQSLERVELRSSKEYADIILKLHVEFDWRFQNCLALERQYILFATPWIILLFLKNFKWSWWSFTFIGTLKILNDTIYKSYVVAILENQF